MCSPCTVRCARACTFIVQLDGRIAFWCYAQGVAHPCVLCTTEQRTPCLCACVWRFLLCLSLYAWLLRMGAFAFVQLGTAPACAYIVHLCTTHACAYLSTVGYCACVHPSTFGYCVHRADVCVLCVWPSCEARVRSVVLKIDARGGNYAKILAALVHNWTG